jgi:hypothetical protein
MCWQIKYSNYDSDPKLDNYSCLVWDLRSAIAQLPNAVRDLTSWGTLAPDRRINNTPPSDKGMIRKLIFVYDTQWLHPHQTGLGSNYR